MIKKELIDAVFKHINSVSEFRSPETWVELSNLLPQYKVCVVAFKAVCEKKCDQSLILDPFKSWSKTVKGLKPYLESGVFYDIDEDPGFFLIESEIVAFDVQSFILDIKRDGYEVPMPILRMGRSEEELISLEVLRLISTKETTWFDLFY